MYARLHSDAKAVSPLTIVFLFSKPYAKNALNLFCHNPENFYFRSVSYGYYMFQLYKQFLDATFL